MYQGSTRGTGVPGRPLGRVGVASRKCRLINEGFSPWGLLICGFDLNSGLFPQPPKDHFSLCFDFNELEAE